MIRRSFIQFIEALLPHSTRAIVQRVEDRTIEALKLQVLKRFVESRGFYLGQHGTMFGSVRRGPLMICTTQPPQGPKQHASLTWAAALEPGERFDAFDVLSGDPQWVNPYSLSRVAPLTPLCTPLSIALEQAVLAMEKLRRNPQPSEEKAAPSATATN